VLDLYLKGAKILNFVVLLQYSCGITRPFSIPFWVAVWTYMSAFVLVCPSCLGVKTAVRVIFTGAPTGFGKWFFGCLYILSISLVYPLYILRISLVGILAGFCKEFLKVLHSFVRFLGGFFVFEGYCVALF
jgi:hypothetical protein